MSTAEETVSTVTTGRGDVQCAIVGDGLPVLVVHGSPGGHDAAIAMSRFLLPHGFRAIAPSRPGYFDTPLSAGRTPDEQADLFVALLDALGVERAGVLCWSGGGPSSYRLAGRHPDRITALVACAAVSRRFVLAHEDIADKLIMGTGLGRRMLELMARHTPEKLVSATLASEGDLTKEQIGRRVAQIMADPQEERFTIDLALTANHAGPRRAGYENDLQQFERIESLDLARIDTHCLIVQGASDSDVIPEYSGFAAEQIRNAELVELATGTHLAFWVHPDAEPVRQRAIELFRDAARS